MTTFQPSIASSYSFTTPNTSQSSEKTTRASDDNNKAANNFDYRDELSISVAGLDAYEKADKSQIYQAQSTVELNTKSYSTEIFSVDKNSKHISPTAWALGVDISGMAANDVHNMFLNNNSVSDALRAKSQASREKIDAKIGDILKSGNITLGENETLNIKLNQKGEIVVGEGMSEDKRAEVEKLLNEDKTLAQDLLYSHAERKMANAAIGSTGASRYILADAILQREYGVSMNDFQKSYVNENNQWEGGHTLLAKNGDGSVLDRIASEESALYQYMESALGDLEENKGDFEVSYSYKNGVTIEKGESDQSSLNKISQNFLSRDLQLWKVAEKENMDYSVTLDSEGSILNAQVTAVRGPNPIYSPADMTRELNSYIAWSAQRGNPFTTQSRLKQYVVDSQRLFQFNTGADSATAKSMNVSFGIGK